MQQFQNVKNIVSIFFVLLILLQSFSKVWIIVSFKLNQEYIAKVLCINRDKPEMLCSGKCFLDERIKADEDQSGKQLPQKLKEQKEVVYCFEEVCRFPAQAPEPVACVELPACCEQIRPSIALTGVFHPPRMS